jgi:hypothetical protein
MFLTSVTIWKLDQYSNAPNLSKTERVKVHNLNVSGMLGFLLKQFTPYTWHLSYAPILFEQIYSNLASCICALRSIFCIVSQIFGALYTLRPTFMKAGFPSVCDISTGVDPQKELFHYNMSLVNGVMFEWLLNKLLTVFVFSMHHLHHCIKVNLL